MGNNLMEALHARVAFHAAGRSFLVGLRPFRPGHWGDSDVLLVLNWVQCEGQRGNVGPQPAACCRGIQNQP